MSAAKRRDTRTAQEAMLIHRHDEPDIHPKPPRKLIRIDLDDHIAALNRQLEESFNPFLDFVKDSAYSEDFGYPVEYLAYWEVQGELHAIQYAMGEAEQRFEWKIKRLQFLIQRFYEANRRREHWFLKANILSTCTDGYV